MYVCVYKAQELSKAPSEWLCEAPLYRGFVKDLHICRKKKTEMCIYVYMKTLQALQSPFCIEALQRPSIVASQTPFSMGLESPFCIGFKKPSLYRRI